MASLLKWAQTWDGVRLAYAERWGADTGLDLSQTAPIAANGTLAFVGDVVAVVPIVFNVVRTNVIHPAGVTAVVGNLQSISSPIFNLNASAPISVFGLGGVAGDVAFKHFFDFGPPLQINTINGSIGVVGNIASISQVLFNIVRTKAVAAAGVAGLSGGIGFVAPIPFNVVRTAPIGVNGASLLVGNVGSPHPLNIVETAPIAVIGGVHALGDINLTITFDIEQSLTPIAMTGVTAITGNIRIPQLFHLVATKIIAAVGTIHVIDVASHGGGNEGEDLGLTRGKGIKRGLGGRGL